MVTLTVYRGDQIVQELDLDLEEIRIGRNADNHIVLPDSGNRVGRIHALIRVERGRYVLSDNDSKIGTMVDGKKIAKVPLTSGQDFVIGPFRVVFTLVEEDPGEKKTVISERSSTAVSAGARASADPKRSAGDGAVAAVAGLPPAALYGVLGLAVVLLAGVLAWQFWPAPPPQVAVVTTTTTIEPTTTTTTIPDTTVDPHTERLTSGLAAIEAADQLLRDLQFDPARRAFNRAITEHLEPILTAEPTHTQALELRQRAIAGAQEARTQLKAATPVTPPENYGPTAIPRRDNESEADYKRRNSEAHTSYDTASRAFDSGDHAAALKIFNELLATLPNWRDVSTRVRNTQEAAAANQKRHIDEAVRQDNTGWEAFKAGRFADAVAPFISAWKELERARELGAPKASEQLADNLGRRRALAKQILDLSRSHWNFRNTNPKGAAEARRHNEMVRSLLPPGDDLRNQAEADQKIMGPGE